MLLIVWGEGSSERVTRDADLLGFGDNSPTVATARFREICAVGVEDDGVKFDIDSVLVEQIRAEQEYVGVRVALQTRVGNARIPVLADIWAQVLDTLAADAHGNLRPLDATHIKVRQDAANPDGGQRGHSVGRTKGGLNTTLTPHGVEPIESIDQHFQTNHREPKPSARTATAELIVDRGGSPCRRTSRSPQKFPTSGIATFPPISLTNSQWISATAPAAPPAAHPSNSKSTPTPSADAMD